MSKRVMDLVHELVDLGYEPELMCAPFGQQYELEAEGAIHLSIICDEIVSAGGEFLTDNVLCREYVIDGIFFIVYK